MQETVGTLNLKIARLKNRLRLLEQQRVLSSAYPDHEIDLIEEGLKVRFQLRQLIQYRQELLRRVTDRITGRLFDGNCQGEQSLYSTA
jgi:hypothetical protein